MKIDSRLVLAALTLFCISPITAQEPSGKQLSAQQSSAEQLSAEQKISAVNLVRWLNTSEMKYRAKAKKFAPLEELVSSGALKEANQTANFETGELNYAAPDHLLPGFSIQLTTSRDGSKYQLSLVDDVHENHWALFSSDQGLIFEGRPMQ